MRFKKYLIEQNEVIPTTKKFKFFKDNPGGGWLKDEREKAKRSKLGGAVTGGFHELFQVPTKMLAGLRGMQGEHLTRKLSDSDVQKLMKAIKSEGIYSPIFINVHYDGEAMINEGNRRALIARNLGLQYVPVEVKYYAGGERIYGPWHPDKIVKVAKPWKKPPKPPSIKKMEKEMEKRREEDRKKREMEREQKQKERKEKMKNQEKKFKKKISELPDDVKDILKLMGYK